MLLAGVIQKMKFLNSFIICEEGKDLSSKEYLCILLKMQS
jgi:hypothetical protein